MSAIGLYVLPDNLAEPVPTLRYMTRPYVRLLSQWQQWNIFSPDPLRRISEYRVDRQEFTGWRTIERLDFATLPWTVRAKELKVLERLEGDWNKLVPSYLLSACAEYPGSVVRLVVINAVLPKELRDLRNIADNSLPNSERVLGTASCKSI